MPTRPGEVPRVYVSGQERASPLLVTLNRWRHRIPFWWWLTYDALVAVVIVVGISPRDPAFWLGFAVLSVAVAIDAVEFWVKRPGVGLD
jgi:hypothetical protein